MDEDWIRWTKQNFVRPLQSLLRPSLGDVSIFLDDQIETGSSWPARLAFALSHSRLLIPVLCPDYFNSEWCRLELSLMRHREKQLDFRTAGNPNGLILPVIINDGDRFPDEVKEIQGKKIHKFAQPCMCLNTPLQENFAELLKNDFCPEIESALENVPAHDSAWQDFVYDQFKEQFKAAAAKQTKVPGLSLHPINPTPPTV